MNVADRPGRLARARAGGRVLVRGESSAARRIASLAVAFILGWLIVLCAREHRPAEWHGAAPLGWSVAVAAATVLIGRGIVLRRPVTAGHAVAAGAVLCAGMAAHLLSFDLLGYVLLAAAGLALMWPTAAAPQPDALPRVWTLVDATCGDPLAPFAMDAQKSYYFNAQGTAALAYRTRLGFAVVSGDPIGDDGAFAGLVDDFADMCHRRGWRIVVLACSEGRLGLWHRAAVGRAMLRVPIGRDVVIDVQGFTMVGRRFRNLRQAVQRTHNCGVSTEIVDEQGLDDLLGAELYEVLRSSHSGSRTERGFSMNLGGALEGRYPGIKLIVARDRWGRVQGFHRYATAGHGSDVTLDVPFRRAGAPNGIDERLSIDMVADAKAHDGQRVSLAFAPFPEIFANKNRGPLHRVFYRLIHLLDPLIRLESLYCYLRKFHSLGGRRYVLLSAYHIPAALIVLLSLEFTPHLRYRKPRRRAIH